MSICDLAYDLVVTCLTIYNRSKITFEILIFKIYLFIYLFIFFQIWAGGRRWYRQAWPWKGAIWGSPLCPSSCGLCPLGSAPRRRGPHWRTRRRKISSPTGSIIPTTTLTSTPIISDQSTSTHRRRVLSGPRYHRGPSRPQPLTPRKVIIANQIFILELC